MDTGTKVIVWSLGILFFFVLLTMGELWLLKRMGFDVLAHLQLTLTQGKTRKFFFEAFGVIAFVVFQPFALLYLFASISEKVADQLVRGVEAIM